MVALLFFAAGCATTRVVHLDTGQGAPIVYTPVESEPVEIGEEAFKRAVTQLMLDMQLDVALEEAEVDERRSLLAIGPTRLGRRWNLQFRINAKPLHFHTS